MKRTRIELSLLLGLFGTFVSAMEPADAGANLSCGAELDGPTTALMGENEQNSDRFASPRICRWISTQYAAREATEIFSEIIQKSKELRPSHAKKLSAYGVMDWLIRYPGRAEFRAVVKPQCVIKKMFPKITKMFSSDDDDGPWRFVIIKIFDGSPYHRVSIDGVFLEDK